MNGKDKPIIVALNVKTINGGLEVIGVSSVYGRNNIKPILNSKPLYWNKQKGRKFANTFGLQLSPELYSHNALLDGNVKTEKNLSQDENLNQDEKFSVAENTNKEFEETAKQYGGEQAYNQAKANGDTELNYKQWVQVRTPSFKNWFGDWENDFNSDNYSKVINEKTYEPLVVYHNTNEKFTTFKRGERDGLSGKGIYFSRNPMNFYGGETVEAFLNIRNPITKWNEKDGMREINSSGIPTKIIKDVYEKFPEFDGLIYPNEITVKNPN